MFHGLILVGHFPEFKDGGVLHQCRPTKGLGAHGPVDWNSLMWFIKDPAWKKMLCLYVFVYFGGGRAL